MTRPVRKTMEKKTTATMPSERKRKVLIVAHNHPYFFPGGAEIIAYDLFKTMREQGEVEPFFMGGVTAGDRKVHTGTPFQTLSHAQDEILFWGADFDYFLQSQNVKSFMYLDFRRFLEKHRPDVIHFHHTMRIGVEAIQVARQALPETKIVYTLHEYVFICHRDGQMVRKHNNELCTEASPSRCNQCFPEITPAEFKIRESFIKAHLECVDRFISPSRFLAERFIAWGIPEHKIAVLENGRKVESPAPFRKVEKGGRRNVFGYFGQINPFKGATLALSAAEHLIRQGYADFRLEIFGNVEQQSEEFKERFFRFVGENAANIGFHGRYRNEDLPSLMAQVDWVIVPSTWWENSPLVIQEAFMHKRPIIASNIGGMAEKVEDYVTGLHFAARNEMDLAAKLRQACEESGLWEKLMNNIAPRLSLEECARKHYALYDALDTE